MLRSTVDHALLAVKIKTDRAPRPSALEGACAYDQCHTTKDQKLLMSLSDGCVSKQAVREGRASRLYGGPAVAGYGARFAAGGAIILKACHGAKAITAM